MNSFSSSTWNQHPHYGLDPGKKEGKRRKKRRKAATSTSSCSQLIHEDPAPSLRSGPVQGEGEAQEEEEEGCHFYQQQLSDQHWFRTTPPNLPPSPTCSLVSCESHPGGHRGFLPPRSWVSQVYVEACLQENKRKMTEENYFVIRSSFKN